MNLFKANEIYFFCFIFLIVFLIKIFLSYHDYQSFKKNYRYFDKAMVEDIYEKTKFYKNKKPRTYKVIKLKTKDYIIYSTRKNLNFNKNDIISFAYYTKKITFKDYLKKSFYSPISKTKILYHEENLKQKLSKFIKSQHENEKLAQVYSALFLATNISKSTREEIQLWGISHLVAISGFHLGLIFSFFFFIFAKPYEFFQQKFFPYSNKNLHLSVLIFFIIFLYSLLIGFVPSFIRAFAMSLFGFFLLLRGLKILNFYNLLITVMIVLLIYPSLAFNVGFYFSVGGVYYILLYFYHFKDKFNNYWHMIFINIWVLFGLNILIHFYFPLSSFLQLSSIPISILFVVFYPLSFFLHIIKEGGLFDSFLEFYLNYKPYFWIYKTPLWLLILNLFLSLFAIKNKFLAILVILMGIIPFILKN